MNLQGKLALVTGGSRGIGAAIVRDLVRNGADVVFNCRTDGHNARGMLREIETHGRRGRLIIADMASPFDAQRCIAEAIEFLGGLHILVHCAGGPAPGRIEDISYDKWRETFDVHVHAAFYLCRGALPAMRHAGEGAIVLVSSVAGIRGVPGAVAYGTAKGAVLQFTRMLARDVADDNIRVNCIAPGIIRTAFHDQMTQQQQSHNLKHRIPLHREGTGEDVAQAVRTLLTNEFMTGEILVIDGGMTMQIGR
jgi:NAD(P)-dependent dehydrogenase (short-subunit alcohol dehydrogenase family)